MKNRQLRSRAALAVAMTLTFGAVVSANPVSAQTAETATGSAYGVQLQGPLPISPTPTVTATVPPSTSASESDAIVEIPADPLATSFTAKVEADASIAPNVDAQLAQTITNSWPDAPSRWHSRGYAITEDLEAVTDQVMADVIESESVAGCDGDAEVFGSAVRIVNLTVGGTAVPILNPSPNQVIFDQGGIKIVLWETNWDPDTGDTTNGSDKVFSNALHITGPAGVDLIVSRSEATVRNCVAAVEPPPPPPPADPPERVDPKTKEAPPATPVEAQPAFTG